MRLALNDEIRNEILWLKSLYLNPVHSLHPSVSLQWGAVRLVAVSNFQDCLAMTGVSLSEVSVLRSLYLEWALWFSQRTGEMDSNVTEEIKFFFSFFFCFEFNGELRFCVTIE